MLGVQLRVPTDQTHILYPNAKIMPCFSSLSIVWQASILATSILPLQASGQTPAIAELYLITQGVSRAESKFHSINIPVGGEEVLADLKGPGKITYFYITDDTKGGWYSGLVLKAYWDGADEPSICVPLADFFGAIGGRTVEFQSALLQVNHACYMCYLPMPFSHRARLVLANDGDRPYTQKVAYGVDSELNMDFAGEKSRLHCEWRRSNPVQNGLHTILEAKGRGQYVGSILQAVSRDHQVWFGEGDTLLHIDGQGFIHSPGTEDEYGSCWEDPGWRTFSAPYCGHPFNENGVNRMYRWYVPNPIRFQQGLKVEIQNQHQNGTATTHDADDYISVAFWYQEGAQKVSRLPSFQERTANSFPEGSELPSPLP